MKFWTCVMCGEPSDYDFCPACEAAEIDRWEQAKLERRQYDERLAYERSQQRDPREP